MPVSNLLRYGLIADALATITTAVMMIAAASQLETWFGIPADVQRYIGIGLVPYAAVVAYLGLQSRVAPAAVWTVVVCNVLWAVASIGVLFTGWLQPTPLGVGFIIAQALIVAALAEFQWFGMRRASGIAMRQPQTT